MYIFSTINIESFYDYLTLCLKPGTVTSVKLKLYIKYILKAGKKNNEGIEVSKQTYNFIFLNLLVKKPWDIKESALD